MTVPEPPTNPMIAEPAPIPPTLLGVGGPPAPIVASGARTALRPSVPPPIDTVLADLDARSSVSRAESAGRRGLLVAILLLVAAAAAAAVVYFTLPYFT
jgi:hypothetical protein